MDASLVNHFIKVVYSETDVKFCVLAKLEKPPYQQIDDNKTLARMEAYCNKRFASIFRTNNFSVSF